MDNLYLIKLNDKIKAVGAVDYREGKYYTACQNIDCMNLDIGCKECDFEFKIFDDFEIDKNIMEEIKENGN